MVKLRKLNGIVKDLFSVGDPFDPLGMVKPKREIIVNLINKKITPNMKGDDIEKHYLLKAKWFHEILEKEKIPINLIEEAVIKIKIDGKKEIMIKTKNKIYQYS